MPKFNSREEYLKWKEEKNIPKTTSENEKESIPTITNAKRNHTLLIIAVSISFVVALSVFIYVSNQSEIQESKITDLSSEIKTNVQLTEQGSNNTPLKLTEVIKKAKQATVLIETPNGSGTGFLISSAGRIVTNSHVVGENTFVTVKFPSGKSQQATVIMKGTPPLDIAILKSSYYDNGDYLSLGNTADCEEGTDVIAIGFPLSRTLLANLDATVTKGIISNCNLSKSGVHYIQTDTPINSGNSGGPLINSNGEVIGVNTEKIEGTGVEGVGFALAIDVVKDFMEGRLTLLEWQFRTEKEEEEERQRIYKSDLIKYFKSVWEIKYTAYVEALKNRSAIIGKGAELGISKAKVEEALKSKNLLNIKELKIPPAGFSSVDAWIEMLVRDVIAGKLTKKDASAIISWYFSY